MVRLSVIVPIYKVEKYLRKCVDSILNQDLTPEEYEIILVDDGSPDDCGAIADEYASRFSNVKVIHQENGGLSVARNTGIDAATGKYIQFVDSDDFLEPNVLKGLVGKMDKDNLDVLRFDYQNVNESYEVFEPYKDVKPFVNLQDRICTGTIFLNERLGFACYAWQFILKAALVKDTNFRFKPGIYFEDTEWTPRVLVKTGRITSVPIIAYNYLLRAGSITTSTDSAKKKKVVKDLLALIESYKAQSIQVENRHWFMSMTSKIAISIADLASTVLYSERNSILSELEKSHIFPLSEYHLPTRIKRKVKLINCSRRLYCTLIHFKNNSLHK